MEKSDCGEEGIAIRYLEINGVWEDHVRYGFTEGPPARAERSVARPPGLTVRTSC